MSAMKRCLVCLVVIFTINNNLPLTEAATPGENISAISSRFAVNKEFEQTYHDTAVHRVEEIVDGSNLQDLGDGVFWEREFNKSNTRYVQFFFDNIRAGDEDYHIRILLDPAAKAVATYSAKEFASGTEFITGLLPPGRLRIQLRGSTQPKTVSFRFSQALWHEEPSRAMVQSGVARWVHVASLASDSQAVAAARAIAMLHIGPTGITCTGALIEPDIIVTNYHCVIYSLAYLKSAESNKMGCDDIIIEFDYLIKHNAGVVTKCKSIKIANSAADIALLTLDPVAIRRNEEIRMPLTVRPKAEGVPDRLSIIHHPVGLPLAIEDYCRRRSSDGADVVQHDCYTLKGSSGAPLLDEKWRWFALHYKGAYPNHWSQDTIESDTAMNGPKYNSAKPAGILERLSDTINAPNK
jgi:V8-like Glu-specific endopeptidase